MVNRDLLPIAIRDRTNGIAKNPKAEIWAILFFITNPMHHGGAEIVRVFLLLADSKSHQISMAW